MIWIWHAYFVQGGAPYERARELEAHEREEDKGGRSTYVVYISLLELVGQLLALEVTRGMCLSVWGAWGWNWILNRRRG